VDNREGGVDNYVDKVLITPLPPTSLLSFCPYPPSLYVIVSEWGDNPLHNAKIIFGKK